MSPNVTPEEAQAIQESLGDAARPQREVVERDFSQPRRLSAGQSVKIRGLLGSVLPDLEQQIKSVLGSGSALGLGRVAESATDDVTHGIEAPLCVLRFMVRGAPGWLVWDSAAAVAAAEKILGSTPGEAEPRVLTQVEGQVLGSFLVGLLEVLLAKFGLQATDPRLVQDKETVGSWKDGGDQADSHRITVELPLETPAGGSTIEFVLPGFPGCLPSTRADEAQEPDRIGGEMAGVEIELRAVLGQGEVALAQLLALEPGDVVPLNQRVGDSLVVLAEDKFIANAELGVHHGRVAVRLRTPEAEIES